MCSGSRAVLRVLAEVDLLAILALEPPGTSNQVCWRYHSSVAENIDQEARLGVHTSDGHPKIHMMEADHVRTLTPAMRTDPASRAGELARPGDEPVPVPRATIPTIGRLRRIEPVDP